MDRAKSFLGVEFGSTRIKAALIDGGFTTVAAGSHRWENRLENGYWTYHLDDVWTGLRDVVAQLGGAGVNVMGVSAMMHGYLAFDEGGKLLVPYRTWRNTGTGAAAAELSEAFGFNIPQRWSIAHLYHAILDGEPHVENIAYLTTLAGYVHWKLTGQKVIGVGDASGMFPVARGTYHADMLRKWDGLTEKHRLPWKLTDILPVVKKAGEFAGVLTDEGAALLSGGVRAGIPLCPPEGDAGTGMAATNSVRPRTCNVSAGTSVFAMAVLEKPLAAVHEEIDVVTTPCGKPVAMVHCNNCSSDIDAWVNLFAQTGMDKGAAYELFFNSAIDGDPDCGGLLSYNYYGGEPITGLTEGRPLFARLPDARFTLANFCRCLLYSALATLRIGMDILTREGVAIERVRSHGGLYKTGSAGQKLTAAALNVPVTVTGSAGEGGAWGMALLAAYADGGGGLSLADFLSERVFAGDGGSTVAPDPDGAAGFNVYMERFSNGLAIERTAVSQFRE